MKIKRNRIIIDKTANSVFVQVVDISGKTVLGKKYKFESGKKPVESAKEFGVNFGGLMIKSIGKSPYYYDRKNKVYHGSIKTFAEGLREAGIEI